MRSFLEESYPDHIREATEKTATVFVDAPPAMEWQKILVEKGWAVPSWPEEWGGTNWTATQKYIWAMECSRAGTPAYNPLSLQLLAPVLMEFGSDEQKQKYLPKMLTGEHYWCQGFSEPGSGSDLASLKLKAERQGDHYLVNGSKLWQTHAQFSDHIFCLVRTSSEDRPQKGISFLLIDMDTPGVKVDPIITMGLDHEVNQVFFEDVKVPAENLVGEEGDGWKHAKFLLEHERGGGSSAYRRLAELEHLKHIVADMQADDPEFNDDLRLLQGHRPHRDRPQGAGDDGAADSHRPRRRQDARRRVLHAETDHREHRTAHSPAGGGRDRLPRACPSSSPTRARTTPPRWCRPTSTAAPPRFSAAARKYRKTSSPRWYWVCRAEKLPMHADALKQEAKDPARLCRAQHLHAGRQRDGDRQRRVRRQRAVRARAPRAVPQLPAVRRPQLHAARSRATSTPSTTPASRILVVRKHDGSLGAFLNICSHRGAPLGDGMGQAKKQKLLSCPYHAWSYDLDGKLVGVPFGKDGFTGLDKSTRCLKPLDVQEQDGMIIRHAQSRAVLRYRRDAGRPRPAARRLRFHDHHLLGVKRVETNISWKLNMDTFHEFYHFDALHPETIAQMSYNNICHYEQFGRNHSMSSPTLAINELKEQDEADWQAREYISFVNYIFPNTVIFVVADHFQTWRVYPINQDKSVVYHSMFLPEPPATEEERQRRKPSSR